MTTAANVVLFVGGCVLLCAGILLLAFAAFWFARSVSALASARVNLVEARERERYDEAEEEARPSIVSTPQIPTQDDLTRAALLARAQRGEITTGGMAGIPDDDDLMHSGMFNTEVHGE